MVARYTPLVLFAQFHDLPQGYSQRIRTYGAEGDISTQQHLDRFHDFCDLEEVDNEYAKMRLFAKMEVSMIFNNLRLLSLGSGKGERTFCT